MPMTLPSDRGLPSATSCPFHRKTTLPTPGESQRTDAPDESSCIHSRIGRSLPPTTERVVMLPSADTPFILGNSTLGAAPVVAITILPIRLFLGFACSG